MVAVKDSNINIKFDNVKVSLTLTLLDDVSIREEKCKPVVLQLENDAGKHFKR